MALSEDLAFIDIPNRRCFCNEMNNGQLDKKLVQRHRTECIGGTTSEGLLQLWIQNCPGENEERFGDHCLKETSEKKTFEENLNVCERDVSY